MKKPKSKKKQQSKKTHGSSNQQDEKKAKPTSSTSWVDEKLFWCRQQQQQQQQQPSPSLPTTSMDGDAVNIATTTTTTDKGITNDDDPSNVISIVSWNCLADAYCNRKSHQHLPLKFQRHVFDRHQRQHHVRQVLRKLVHQLHHPDLICLQEVDAPLEITHCLQELGYTLACETIPTSCSEGSSSKKVMSTTGRVDASALFCKNGRFEILDHQILSLDDVAIQCSKATSDFDGNGFTTTTDTSSKIARSNLQGVQASFVRKNKALLVRLQPKNNSHDGGGPPIPPIVMVVMHLYWNPAYEYVKLCQAHFVLQNAKAFAKGDPVIVAGDFNSQPNGAVHQYLVNGSFNAKRVAPWYQIGGSSQDQNNNSPSTSADSSLHIKNNEDKDQTASGVSKSIDEENDETNNKNDNLASDFQNMSLSATKQQPQATATAASDSAPSGPAPPPQQQKIRYMLDFTLNRFCRWLRILGLDAALETDEEEKSRTKEGKIVIFDRCLKERRTLVTTSSKLLRRKDCPPGTYLLDTKSLIGLELSLVHLLLSHGVTLEPDTFLSRCVVCNGSIERVYEQEQIDAILSSHQAPDDIQDDITDVFQCDGCAQGYWWCDLPTSSASRVKTQATKLLELCIRGGVPVSSDMGMFDFVNVGKIRTEQDDDDEETREVRSLWKQRLDIIEWLQDENLECPLGALTSSYGVQDEDGTKKESLPFSNVTYHFVGLLDYIMFNQKDFQVVDQLFVPTSFDDLNGDGIRNGHLLPSNVWPSDHLAIGAKLNFVGQTDKGQSSSTTSTPDNVYAPKDKDQTTNAPKVSGPSSVLPTNNLHSMMDSTSTAAFCLPTTGGQAPPPSLVPPGALPPRHGERCACGCVPNIPSLFEMAELRRQAKLKKQSQGQ